MFLDREHKRECKFCYLFGIWINHLINHQAKYRRAFSPKTYSLKVNKCQVVQPRILCTKHKDTFHWLYCNECRLLDIGLLKSSPLYTFNSDCDDTEDFTDTNNNKLGQHRSQKTTFKCILVYVASGINLGWILISKYFWGMSIFLPENWKRWVQINFGLKKMCVLKKFGPKKIMWMKISPENFWNTKHCW